MVLADNTIENSTQNRIYFVKVNVLGKLELHQIQTKDTFYDLKQKIFSKISNNNNNILYIKPRLCFASSTRTDNKKIKAVYENNLIIQTLLTEGLNWPGNITIIFIDLRNNHILNKKSITSARDNLPKKLLTNTIDTSCFELISYDIQSPCHNSDRDIFYNIQSIPDSLYTEISSTSFYEGTVQRLVTNYKGNEQWVDEYFILTLYRLYFISPKAWETTSHKQLSYIEFDIDYTTALFTDSNTIILYYDSSGRRKPITFKCTNKDEAELWQSHINTDLRRPKLQERSNRPVSMSLKQNKFMEMVEAECASKTYNR